MSYVSPGEAARHFCVSKETLRKWDEKGIIECIKTEGGHRRYKIPENRSRQKIIYARVSSKKQSGDLERQIKYLQDLYPDYTVIKDIGSGLNFKRKGFRRVLDELFKGNIAEVVISSSDRFSRFGTSDFFGWLFERFGAQLRILNTSTDENSGKELTEDLFEVITVFSARYHGRRSYTDNKKNKDLPKQGAENTIQKVLSSP